VFPLRRSHSAGYSGPVDLRPASDEGAAISALYLHIPFCERKCEYCDFVSVAGAKGQHEYVAALRAEVRALAAGLPDARLESIFCGGGTPGLLDLGLMDSLMREVFGSFSVAAGAEVTLEVNPSSTSVARASSWRAAGFNRVSVGVQSTHADILGFLGRVHDGDRALDALREVRAAGFDNVSADLIYAVPGLDDARWMRSLHAIVDSTPDHLSCYELTVEDGTPLHAAVAAGRARAVDPETALRQHHLAVDELRAHGYDQYEVSNFARDGRTCRHNLVYWRNGHYAAAGVGAHGHLPASAAARFALPAPTLGAVAFRYQHGRNVGAYVRAVNGRAGTAWRDIEWIDPTMREEESLMLGLRLEEGVELHGAAVVGEARSLARAGMLQLFDGRARATPRGQEVLNELAARLAQRCAPDPVVS
jgi:oxygen-independent coproporphyrinogen-3 oxidase